MNYATLKSAIQEDIKSNHNQEITGPILQGRLFDMIGSLGRGYQLIGSAVPASTPGTPDERVAYICATPGTYAGMGNIVVAAGEVAILGWDSSWSKLASWNAGGLTLAAMWDSLTNTSEDDYANVQINASHLVGYVTETAMNETLESYVRNDAFDALTDLLAVHDGRISDLETLVASGGFGEGSAPDWFIVETYLDGVVSRQSLKLNPKYVGMYAEGYVSAGGISAGGGGGGGGITLDGMWNSLTNSVVDAYASTPINLAHIPNITVSKVTDIETWISGKGYLTNADLSNYLPLTGGTMANTNLVTNMNADLLDGQHASDFALASSLSNYLPLIAGYSYPLTGALYIEGGIDTKIVLNNTDGEYYSVIAFYEDGIRYASITSTSIDFRIESNRGPLTYNGYTVWHAGNSNLTTVAWSASTLIAAGLSTLSGGIRLGTSSNADATRLVWDETNNAWHLTGNLYADGFISAGGISSGSGSGGIDLDAMWGSLTNSVVDSYASTTIALAHIPDITTAKVSNIESWISGKGYATSTDLLGYVPTSRTINSHTLTGNITLTMNDIGVPSWAQASSLSYSSLPALYIGNARVQSSAQTAQDIGGIRELTCTRTIADSFSNYDSGNGYFIGLARDGLGSGTGTLIYTYGDNPTLFYNAGSETMRITYSRVGILTTNPQHALDVSGTANATELRQNGVALGSRAFDSTDYLPLSGGTMANTNLVTNMNADLLDGQHASYYAAASSLSNYLPLIADYSHPLTGPLFIRCGNDTKLVFDNTDSDDYSKISFCANGTEYAYIAARSIDLQIASTRGPLVYNGYTVWTAGNANLTTVPWSASSLTLNGTISGATNVYVSNQVQSPSTNYYASGAGYWIGYTEYGLGSGTGTLIFTYGNNPTLFYNSGSEWMRITGTGYVGINNSNPQYRLDVNGSINSSASYSGVYYVGGTSAYLEYANSAIHANVGFYSNNYISAGGLSTSSDARLKTGVQTIDSERAWKVIMGLRPTEFRWIENGEESAGFIAQEVEPIVPFAVKEIGEVKRLNYDNIFTYGIQAIRDMKFWRESTEQRIKRLEKKIDELQTELNILRA